MENVERKRSSWITCIVTSRADTRLLGWLAAPFAGITFSLLFLLVLFRLNRDVLDESSTFVDLSGLSSVSFLLFMVSFGRYDWYLLVIPVRISFITR